MRVTDKDSFLGKPAFKSGWREYNRSDKRSINIPRVFLNFTKIMSL